VSNISFADDAWSEYLYWQTQDKKTLKKINALLKEIQRNPFDGAGKPEPLKNDKSGLWSRRINDKDRLVYSVNNDFIIVYQCKCHYDD
jgi:addiction module toxin, txe/yoeB family